MVLEELAQLFDELYPALTAEIRSYYQKRYSEDVVPVDDLTQQCMASLWSYWRVRIDETHTTQELKPQLQRMAKVIAKRRVADYFRQTYREETHPYTELGSDPRTTETLDAEQLLARLVTLIRTLPPSDRDLIALVADSADGPLGLSPRDRKRLSRLRRRLRDELQGND